MKLQFTLLLLFTAWLVPAGSAYAQVSNPSGDLTPVQNEDIWAQTLKGNHFNEFWTYQFYLNNDLTVHITFSVANFGSLKSPVSGVQISVDRLNGEIYQLSREYDLDYLVQDRENLMFRNRDQRKLYFIGELPKEHRVRIHTSKDGVEYDIDLSMHKDRKSTRLNSSHVAISYAVFSWKKKSSHQPRTRWTSPKTDRGCRPPVPQRHECTGHERHSG